VCVSEEPYEKYRTDDVGNRIAEFSLDWERNIYQISGIPIDQITTEVHELCRRGKYIFATDLVDDFYESFGPSWEAFVEAVKTCPAAAVGATNATTHAALVGGPQGEEAPHCNSHSNALGRLQERQAIGAAEMDAVEKER
jgi:hypothetical protein